jgi:hypothetical protein
MSCHINCRLECLAVFADRWLLTDASCECDYFAEQCTDDVFLLLNFNYSSITLRLVRTAVDNR